MKYIFHPQALGEYRKATLYYSEISPKLARAFIKEIETSIKAILEYPQAWAIVEEEIRRRCLHQFPFGIYYTIKTDHIEILAIMHMKREPGYWKNRL